jgi:crotonobetainyl-CoA:carnitine CoA-transferase CaiB-like acyl-CoA transferase
MNDRIPGALDGLRVLDFSRVLAGPFCTMLLADFGADVIKVERPGLGDDTRHWGPPWVGEGEARLSAYYVSANRNKRSLTLNLKSAEGQSLARQLIAQSDVLVENFKVGQMADYGLDYASLRVEHPGLVYCSITGYGQDGPYANRPGYDYVIQGQSGLMSITGPFDGQPYKVGVAIADVLAGLFAANAIQAALRHRDQSGEGQYIDISLLTSQVAALVNVVSNYLITKKQPQRYGNVHPNIVPYEVFDAADKPFILAVGNDGQFRQCCQLIGRPELIEDERFVTNADRVKHRDSLVSILQPILAGQSAARWIQEFLAVGVPAGPINDIAEVVSDPHIQASGLIESIMLANGEAIDMVGPAPRLSGTPPVVRRPPPALGQDTDQILQEVLGIDQITIAAYREERII